MRKYNPSDYVGQRFGYLTMLSVDFIKNERGTKTYPFQCECGNVKYLPVHNVITGHDVSCGCKLGKDYINQFRIKHGLARHPLYKTWNNITQRAGKHKNYLNVTVCEEWKSDFANFYEWAIHSGWQKGLSIDRIDYNGNYEPSNCRWVTHYEQMRNTSRTHNITINGVTKCLKDWCKHYNTNSGTFHKRIKRGMSEVDALTIPINKKYSNKSKSKKS